MKRLFLVSILISFILSVDAQTDKNKGWRLFKRKNKKDQKTEKTFPDLKDTIPALAKVDTLSITEEDIALSLENPSKVGAFEVFQDPALDTLLMRDYFIRETNPKIDGYKLQIFSSSGPHSRQQVREKQSSFLKIYPKVPSEIKTQMPNFKLRVGNFLTRLEATKLLREIKNNFPNSFIVKDKITVEY